MIICHIIKSLSLRLRVILQSSNRYCSWQVVSIADWPCLFNSSFHFSASFVQAMPWVWRFGLLPTNRSVFKSFSFFFFLFFLQFFIFFFFFSPTSSALLVLWPVNNSNLPSASCIHCYHVVAPESCLLCFRGHRLYIDPKNFFFWFHTLNFNLENYSPAKSTHHRS